MQYAIHFYHDEKLTSAWSKAYQTARIATQAWPR